MRMTARFLLVGVALAALAGPAFSWELSGAKQVALHTGDGETFPIGTATFTPQGDKTSFTLDIDTSRLKDFFLSMREFKCVEGKEIHCHVPYPYANPRVISAGDLRWLETSLIFMFKTPAQFGATLANGLYYEMTLGEEGIAGVPRAVDLNEIAAPPDDPGAPPFPPADRLEIEDGARWIAKMTIR